MRIESEDGTSIESPTEADIERIIDSLGGEGNVFAILTARPMTYMQTAVLDDRFQLEYQEDDTEHHYEASEPPTKEAVVATMQQYALGDDRWKSAHEWKHLDLSGHARSGCAGALLLLALGVWAAVFC